MNFGELSTDILYEILEKNTYRDVISICQTDTRFYQFCKDETVRRLIQRKKEEWKYQMKQDLLNTAIQYILINLYDQVHITIKPEFDNTNFIILENSYPHIIITFYKSISSPQNIGPNLIEKINGNLYITTGSDLVKIEDPNKIYQILNPYINNIDNVLMSPYLNPTKSIGIQL
jgi:hypothetical protein